MRFIDQLPDRIRDLHRDRFQLIAAMVVGAALFLLCAELAGDVGWAWRIGWAATLLLLLVEPQGGTVGVHLVACLIAWFAAGTDHATWWSLPAGAALLLVFTAHTLFTSAPENAPVPPSVVDIWRRRALVCLVLALVSGALTLTLAGGDQRQGPVLTVIALAVIAGGLILLPRYAGGRSAKATDSAHHIP